MGRSYKVQTHSFLYLGRNTHKGKYSPRHQGWPPDHGIQHPPDDGHANFSRAKLPALIYHFPVNRFSPHEKESSHQSRETGGQKVPLPPATSRGTAQSPPPPAAATTIPALSPGDRVALRSTTSGSDLSQAPARSRRRETVVETTPLPRIQARTRTSPSSRSGRTRRAGAGWEHLDPG